MKEKEEKSWRIQIQFLSEFTDANDDALTLCGSLRFDEDSANGKPRAELEFFGDCEDEDGELVTRKKHYDITPEIAADILDALKALGPFEKDRPPKIGRERFRETAGGFVISLKQTPNKTFFTIQHPSDGWKFETEDRDGFFEAFSNAAH